MRNQALCECPVAACQILRRKDRLICEVHWEKLPNGIKQKVLNAYAQARAASNVTLPTWLPGTKQRAAMWARFDRAAWLAVNYFTGYGVRAA